MPLMSSKSSTDEKVPLVLRCSMIFSAVAGPMPGNKVRSSKEALFKLILRDGAVLSGALVTLDLALLLVGVGVDFSRSSTGGLATLTKDSSLATSTDVVLPLNGTSMREPSSAQAAKFKALGSPFGKAPP